MESVQYEVTATYLVTVEDNSDELKSIVANSVSDGGILNTDSNTRIIDIQPTSARVKEVKVIDQDFLKKETAEVI